MWPKCAFDDQKGLIWNKDMPSGNPPYHGTKKCGLQKYQFLFLKIFGSKVVFWVKNGVLSVSGPGVHEVADLNQRQKTIKMNHRNKIQSLVSPTNDPGDAPDCMCESGPLYLEYGHICHKSANSSKYGFSLKPKLDFVTLVLLKSPKSMTA